MQHYREEFYQLPLELSKKRNNISKYISRKPRKSSERRLFTFPLTSFFLSSVVSAPALPPVPGFFLALALPLGGGDGIGAAVSSSSSSFGGATTSGLTTTAPPPLIVFTTGGGGGGAAEGGGRGSPRAFNSIAFSAYSLI